jgi:hypothetical protein
MHGLDLAHLAVVSGVGPGDSDLGAALATSCREAARLARDAFAVVPGLRAFSWLDPGLDARLLGAPSPVAADRCAAGARVLAAAAVELGATLRVCGRRDGLPDVDAPPPAAPGRTLLWFQRYGGRDEIVRAAGRFLAAHPDRRLPDDELDAWLDTAGIPDPDLLLYVDGPPEQRDVLLWQGSYAEIGYVEGPVSACGADRLRVAVADYADRQRRFGK